MVTASSMTSMTSSVLGFIKEAKRLFVVRPSSVTYCDVYAFRTVSLDAVHCFWTWLDTADGLDSLVLQETKKQGKIQVTKIELGGVLLLLVTIYSGNMHIYFLRKIASDF